MHARVLNEHSASRKKERKKEKHVSPPPLTLAVVEAVEGVVIGGGPRLVEGGACVAEGGVGRVTVVHTGVPGVGVVRLLNLHWKTQIL